jgi:hypothetical protein
VGKSVLSGGSHLREVKPCEVLIESVPFNEQIEKISAPHVLQNLQRQTLTFQTRAGHAQTHKVKVVPVLEGVEHLHNPVATCRGRNQRRGAKDITLGTDVSLLTLAEHVGLPQLLNVEDIFSSEAR